MINPNQRLERHGKPQNLYEIPAKQRANLQQGYYDSYDQSVNSAVPSVRSRKIRKNRHPAVILIKALLLITFCLSAGLFWHYLSTNNWVFPGSTAGAAAAHANGANTDHNNELPVYTQDVIPNTHMISFSNDTTKPLYGKVIILDPGHGGTDSGCVYPANKPTYFENTINLIIAESTKEALEAKGATVIMIRTDDSWISLYHRIALTHLNCLQYADEFGINTINGTDEASLISELSDTIEINSDTIDNGGMGIMVGTGVGSELNLLMDLEKDFTNILFGRITSAGTARAMNGSHSHSIIQLLILFRAWKVMHRAPLPTTMLFFAKTT